MPQIKEVPTPEEVQGFSDQMSKAFDDELSQQTLDAAGKYMVMFGVPKSGPDFAFAGIAFARGMLLWMLWKGYVVLTEKAIRSEDEPSVYEQASLFEAEKVVAGSGRNDRVKSHFSYL